MKDNRIVVPEELRKTMLSWYHETLNHPGISRMKATIKKHFYWPGMDAEIVTLVKECDTCQRFKKTAVRPVGHLPLRDLRSAVPWERVRVDCIGPWKIPIYIISEDKKIHVKVSALTMVCEATLWPEIGRIFKMTAEHIAHKFDTNWLCRYPRPSVVIHDNGGEFNSNEFQELLESFSIKSEPTTVRNPQSNGILERMHLSIGDMLRTMDLEIEKRCPTEVQDVIDSMFQAAAWALRTTVSTVTNTSPGENTFQRDMIYNFKLRTDWEAIERKRLERAERDNVRENSKRKYHEYKVGDKVLIVRKSYERKPKLSSPTEGPFKIIKVNNNGTVTVQKAKYTETVSIRRVKPYHGSDNNVNE